MPRASWKGFLRLSLVSCPIYLSPATTRTKSIRLHQVWQPALAEEPDDSVPDDSVPDGGRSQHTISSSRAPAFTRTVRPNATRAVRQLGSRSALTIPAPA